LNGSKIISTLPLILLAAASSAWALAESAGPAGSNALALHETGLRGRGVTIGVLSAGNARSSHEAFFEKGPDGEPIGTSAVENLDFTGAGIEVTNHDTWIAGIAASRGGINHPDYIGISPGTDVIMARVTAGSEVPLENIKLALDELLARGCRVVFAGIAITGEPDGTSQYTLLLDYFTYSSNMILALPSGNEGGSISIFGDAFNSITVGGLALAENFGSSAYLRVGIESGSGPTSDGRRKPELTGPSEAQTIPNGSADNSWITWSSDGGQTSFSVPHAAGTAALLLEAADGTAEPDDDRPEVIRAVMVNAAFPNMLDKSGSPIDPAARTEAWHPQAGYGRIDALRAWRVLTAGRIQPGETTEGPAAWAWAAADPGQSHSYFITAVANSRLALAAAWNRKVIRRGLLYSAESPPLDFDLELNGPDGGLIQAAAGTDNNLEKMDILLPVTGTYSLTVSNTSTVAGRSYAMAMELISPLKGDFPPVNYAVDSTDLSMLTEGWLAAPAHPELDLVDDGRINLADFAGFAPGWGRTIPEYYLPGPE
jgi:hypothetical protein